MSKKLWKLECEGYYGSLYGVFKATDEEIAGINGKTAHFGDVLGKYSDVDVERIEEYIEMISDNPAVVAAVPDVGYNPVEVIGEYEEEYTPYEEENEVDE